MFQLKSRSRRRVWLAWGLLGVAALGAVWELRPLPDAQRRLAAQPAAGEGFRSWPVALADEELAKLGPARATRRLYCWRGDWLVVTVVDATRNRHAVHDPLYCFRGAGWRVTGEETLAVGGDSLTLCGLSQDGAATQAAYWFTNGRRRHGSIVGYWLETTLRRVSLGWSGPEPIFVLVQPRDHQPLPRETLATLPPFLDF